MPDPRRLRLAKVRIAAVAVTAICILAVLTYLLSGGTWLQAKTWVNTHIPDATGLEPDADVLLNGVKIGRVASVELTHSRDPNRVVAVRLTIEARYLSYIPEDSTCTIDSENLLGDKFVNITMGKSSQHVPAGGDLRFPPPSNMMQNIDMRQFDEQLRIIDQTIRDIQEGNGPLGQFVASDDLYRQFLDGAVRIEKKMRAATASQSQLGQMLYSSKMHDDLVTSLKQLDDSLAKMASQPMLRDTAQYDQIRDQLVKLHGTLADLNAGKGAGGEFLVSDAAYVSWKQRVSGLIQNVDAINSGEGAMGHLLMSADTYESLNGQLREIETTVKEFRADPRKFLRVKVF